MSKLNLNDASTNVAIDDAGISEDFMDLATNLVVSRRNGILSGSVALVSVDQDDTQADVAVGLVKALASINQSVALVNANLRSSWTPQIPNFTSLNLQSVLDSGQVDDDTTNVIVSPADSVPNPIATLESDGFSALIRSMEAGRNFVVVSTPALMPLGDAKAVLGTVKNAILIIHRRQTRARNLKNGLTVLNALHTNVIGYVTVE